MGSPMTMLVNVRTPSIDNTMSIQQSEDYRARGGRTWVSFYETSNLAFLAMVMKTSCTISCEIVFSSQCTQQRKWIHIGSKSWLQIQCDTLRIKRWKRLNLVHNAMEKTSKGKWKKKMTKHVNNQAPTPSLTRDFKCL
jgi:hypothetical protein